MSSPLQAQVESALADLRAQEEKIRTLQRQLERAATTVKSKDRMIEATVDAQGRLTAINLRGDRYRTLAPAEFTARLVETVRAAQAEAAREAASQVKALMPSGFGFGLADALDGGFDMDRMFTAAARLVQDSALHDETPGTQGRNGDG